MKELQSLNGKFAALNRFVSKAMDKCLPFFRTLRKSFEWTDESAVSAALMREEEGSQRPVYFISRAFRGVEERYPRMEKLAFALITAARKLKAYFQAHTIIILTDQPLKRA